NSTTHSLNNFDINNNNNNEDNINTTGTNNTTTIHPKLQSLQNSIQFDISQKIVSNFTPTSTMDYKMNSIELQTIPLNYKNEISKNIQLDIVEPPIQNYKQTLINDKITSI